MHDSCSIDVEEVTSHVVLNVDSSFTLYLCLLAVQYV